MTSNADKRLGQIAKIRRERPTVFNLSRPLIVERARLTAERQGRRRPTENEALAQAAPVAHASTGGAMATTIKRKFFQPSKATTPVKPEGRADLKRPTGPGMTTLQD